MIFEILIKLIYVEGKSEYRTSLQKQNQYYITYLKDKRVFFHISFKFAYYTYTRIGIYFHLNNEFINNINFIFTFIMLMTMKYQGR